MSQLSKGIAVVSGGTAANNLVDVFSAVADSNHCTLSYIIPISDNGGSSSELIRVFGGPGIGDVRSRLIRLIPNDDETSPERSAIRAFFNHRLPKDATSARLEWLDIVEARSDLWIDISSAKQELIRSFLNLLNLEAVKRIRPSSTFNFSGASIGNLFLTGARLFSGSFESAIYLLSSICNVSERTSVIPAINTNFTHHIACGLEDGSVIVGQNAISHPEAATALPQSSLTDSQGHLTPQENDPRDQDGVEDANLPGTLPSLRRPNIEFSKLDEEPLTSRIDRIWYINVYGQEIRPRANPKAIEAIGRANCVIYSIGSLYTSILPALVLGGIGDALMSPFIKSKILMLNGCVDRETGPPDNPMTALDYVAAIAKAASSGSPRVPQPVIHPSQYSSYVTHVIYLEAPGTPRVDKAQLAAVGIEAIRLYGRRAPNDQGSFYDDKALLQALQAVTGRPEVKSGDLSRRNTLQHQRTPKIEPADTLKVL